MKLFIVFVIWLCLCFNVYGQQDSSHYRCPDVIRGPNVEYLLLTNHHFFRSLNTESEKVDSLSIYCDDYRTIYSLDGLEIIEQTFLSAELYEDVTEDDGWYIYIYKNGDTTNCVQMLKLFLSIKIPILLNGMELEGQEAKSALRQIHPDKIIYVKKKSCFLCRTVLEILTK